MLLKEQNEDFKFISGAAFLTLSMIILKIIGLIYKIPMSYMLTDEGMGYFNSAYTIYTFFYIIGTSGIPKAISIICAKCNESEAKGIFNVAFKFFFIIGILLSLILFFCAKHLAKAVGNENSFYPLIAISPSVFFVCSSGVIRGYLSGRMTFLPIAISEIISGLGKLIFGILFAKIAIVQGKVLPITCAYAIFGITLGSFLGLVYLYISYKRAAKKVITIYQGRSNILKEILKLSLPITLASALSGFVNIIDLTIIMNSLKLSGFNKEVSAVIYGNYTTLGVPMLTLVITLITPITQAILPQITRNNSEFDFSKAKSALSLAQKMTFFISAPSFFIFSFFSYETLAILFENSSAVIGAPFLLLLAPSALFYSILVITNTYLESTGRIKTAVFSLLLGAIIKCAVSLTLISNPNISALGAPIGTSISYFCSMIFSFIFTKKGSFKTNEIIGNFKTWFFFSAIATIPAVIIRPIISKSFSARSSSFMIVAIFAFTYLLLGVSLLLRNEEIRSKLSKYTKKKRYDY